MLKDEGLEVPKGLQPEPRTGISTPTLPPPHLSQWSPWRIKRFPTKNSNKIGEIKEKQKQTKTKRTITKTKKAFSAFVPFHCIRSFKTTLQQTALLLQYKDCGKWSQDIKIPNYAIMKPTSTKLKSFPALFLSSSHPSLQFFQLAKFCLPHLQK